MSAAQDAFTHGLQLAPASTALNENAGLLFFREGKYTEAKKLLRRATQLGSQKPGVLFSLAAAQLRTGEQPAALEGLKELEPALSQVPQYWEERGRAELGVDPLLAEKSFERALDLSPSDLTALDGAAAAAERQGLEEKSLAYLIRARAADPDNVSILMHFATVCIKRDLGPDAIEALQRARRLESTNFGAIYLLARANISVQNWQAAYDLFRQFAERYPDFAPAYHALGWLDLRLNQPADARKQLEECLRLSPSLSDARYELAQLEYDDGNMKAAEKSLSTVLLRDPHHAKAETLMSDILLRQGDLASAQKYLESATRDDPKLAAAHYKLSLIYAREHELEKSRREKDKAAELIAAEKQASKTQLKLVLPETAGEGKSPISSIQ